MQTIWAEQALLPEGWARGVRVTVGGDGRIEAVTRDAPREGGTVGILLPAPVNAHSHAFQRAMAGLTERRGPNPRDSFWTWRQLMYRFLDRLTPDDVEAITAYVQMEMLEAGYATNVEFHYLHHQPDGQPYDSLSEMADRVIAATQMSGIGLTLLPVHYQFGGCDFRALAAGQVRFGNDMDRFSRLLEDARRSLDSLHRDVGIGVAPHSLRAVAPDDLPRLVALVGDGPVHMHLAEQVAEVEEVEAAYGARPVEWLLDNVAVDQQWCLIHCTQMQAHETRGLAATRAIAGLCPITESSLGDGIFDCVNWIDADGRLAIGSDSNVRISLSEELRTLEYSQRLRDRSRAALATTDRSTGRHLFDLTLEGGATAAGRQTGAIAPGLWADLMTLDEGAVDLAGRSGDTLLDSFIFVGDDSMVRDVWSGGRHLVAGGEHIRHEEIAGRYRVALRRLTDDL